MKISRLPLLAVLSVVLVGIAAGCGGSSGVPSNSVAAVDGTPVTRSDLDGLFARARAGYKRENRPFPKAGTEEFNSLQQQAVAFLVQRVIYAEEAAALGIEITEKEVDKRAADVLKLPQFAGDQKKLDAELKKQGYTQQSFRDELRDQILSEKLYDEVTAEITVADAALRKYYDENKAQYSVPESRKVRHILVATKAKAEQLIAELKAGADFAELAKKNSTDPGSKDQGGEYNVAKGQTVPEFEKASFELKTNEISAPIKTQFGFHIIQPLENVKKGTVTPFAEVKATIKSTLEKERKDNRMVEWQEEVKTRYDGKTTYASGFAPPAAALAPGSDLDEEN